MPVEPMSTPRAASCVSRAASSASPAASLAPPGQGASLPATWVRLGYEYAVFYLGLMLFAAPMLMWSLLAGSIRPFVPRRIGVAIGRRVVTRIFRTYLLLLTSSGLVKLDLGALDALRDERGLIIAPNHPAMLDVVLMVSRLPRAVCIMKADLGKNIILGGATHLAGYIHNDSAFSMIRQASAEVRSGGQLLIFPEGTRTTQYPVNRFKRGFAMIAKTAGVPVQTVLIESNSSFLSKSWPWFKKPAFPLLYRVTLGRRFEVDCGVKEFVADLEDYYREVLGPKHPAQAASGSPKPRAPLA